MQPPPGTPSPPLSRPQRRRPDLTVLFPQPNSSLAVPLPLPPTSHSWSHHHKQQQHQFSFSELDRVKQIGSGRSSTVYQVINRHTGQLFALKVIHGILSDSVHRQILHEINILRGIDHPNVVKCHDMFDHEGKIQLLLEFMEGGSLEGVKITNEGQLSDFASQILSGLSYLHKRHIVHRDIRPSNLLINSGKNVKFADFGIGRILVQTMNPCNSSAGTIAYKSPEMINTDLHHGRYGGYAGDIWSFGVTILEFYLGMFPFAVGREGDWASLIVEICVSKPPEAPPSASMEFRDFIACCLQKDPERRWTAAQLLRHPFILRNSSGGGRKVKGATRDGEGGLSKASGQPLLRISAKPSSTEELKRSCSDSLNEKAEKIREYTEEMLKKGKVLNRKKDFLLLISSYPMIMVDKDKSQKWINDVLEIIRSVKLTEKSEPLYASYRDLIGGLSSRIEEQLYDPLMEDVERILPRDVIEKMYKPLEANTLSLVDKEHNKPLHVPQGIFDMAVDFSVHQILENIRSGSIRYIRITGRGEKKVIQAMKDQPNVASRFKYVLRVTLSENQSNTEIQKEIAQQLGLMSAVYVKSKLESELRDKLQSSRFLLLLEDCHDDINLFDVGIPLQQNVGVVVFTSKSIQAAIEADMEIRIEDHLLSWELFCRNLGEVVLLSSIQQIAVRMVQECQGHLLAIILMARSLKNVTDFNFWELALQKLSMMPSSQIEGIDKAIINALTFIWEAMDNIAKHRIRHFALYPKGEWIDKGSVISHWIEDHLVYSHDEGNYILRSLTNAFLVEDRLADYVRLPVEIYDVLVNLLVPKMHPVFLKQGDLGLTESTKEEEWDAKEIHLMDNELSELPESPNCPSLIALYLQKNYDLTIIPSLFFEHMPVLQVLDLSHTSIKSLPESLPKLVALQKLFLRGCELFMELSPQVGELGNLEELDLDETQIIYLPVEVRKLVKLKRLRVSFYGEMYCSKKRLQSSTVIHTGVISNLSQLTELCIDVNPGDERWDATVEAIIEEVCSSKMLDTLSLCLPKVELLKKHGMGSTSLICHPLSRFSFVVGHQKQRIISRVPDEIEARFKECEKCLKFVNGRGIPGEIKEVLKNATAFYLERNATAVNLSEFEIENMEKLRFCILAECSEMQTIIAEGEFYEESSVDSDSAEEVVLGSLLYLGIYYMNNLRSIWKGPIHKCCLSNLKVLAIHTCPKLSTIFSVDLLANLMELEELIIEDCPQVTCLVSHASSNPASVDYLPSLRKVSLLFLPELVNISGGLNIAPKLERIGFYYCPKLENLSKTELSSKNLKVIKGERKWWDEALKWNESDWGSRPDHLNDIFHEIDEEKDVRTQLTEQE